MNDQNPEKTVWIIFRIPANIKQSAVSKIHLKQILIQGINLFFIGSRKIDVKFIIENYVFHPYPRYMESPKEKKR